MLFNQITQTPSNHYPSDFCFPKQSGAKCMYWTSRPCCHQSRSNAGVVVVEVDHPAPMITSLRKTMASFPAPTARAASATSEDFNSISNMPVVRGPDSSVHTVTINPSTDIMRTIMSGIRIRNCRFTASSCRTTSRNA